MTPTVTTWTRHPGPVVLGVEVDYGIDSDGVAWERATGPRGGEPSYFPLGKPGPGWAPADGNIDVLEED